MPSTSQNLTVADAPKKRILFIGNSLTINNNLPRLLAGLSIIAREPIPIEAAKIAHGGWTLEMHYDWGAAQRKIAKTPWDYVVLQEYSTRPLENFSAFSSGAQKLAAEIHKTNAQILLYAPWTLKGQESHNARLQAAYEKVGQQINATVIKVGAAWTLARTHAPTLKLYVFDGKHPTKAGTYLTACVFYLHLYGHLPTLPGAPIVNNKKLSNLKDPAALILQQIARDSLQSPHTAPN